MLYKQIEMLAIELDLLLHIVETNNENGDILEGIEMVNQGLMQCLNINIDEINNIPIEHFITTITIDNELNNKNLEKLADLFYITAKSFNTINENEISKRLNGRALKIYLYLTKIEIDFPYERHVKIKELNEILLQ